MAKNTNVVDAFASVGVTEIEEAGDLGALLLNVFQKYPDKMFTQPAFVEVLGKSNPFINKALRRLCDAGKITRQRSGNKFFYQLAK